jgi:zinc transporter ZupT
MDIFSVNLQKDKHIMNTSFILMLLSASVLPLLALLALVLRRNLFTGKLKLLFLGIGLVLLAFAVADTFHEHGEEFGVFDIISGGVAALITLFILSRFTHKHAHNLEDAGAKGIVISEAFHSLIDGAVIGATYLVSPLLGYAATLGIVTHELPKIVGTLTLFRSLGMSVKKTILYGIAAQIGSPAAALLVYTLGTKISHEQFHLLEIASVSSLGAIVLWIVYLEIRFHAVHDAKNHTSDAHKHTH